MAELSKEKIDTLRTLAKSRNERVSNNAKAALKAANVSLEEKEEKISLKKPVKSDDKDEKKGKKDDKPAEPKAKLVLKRPDLSDKELSLCEELLRKSHAEESAKLKQARERKDAPSPTPKTVVRHKVESAASILQKVSKKAAKKAGKDDNSQMDKVIHDFEEYSKKVFEKATEYAKDLKAAKLKKIVSLLKQASKV